ncbi:MAG: anhydro-N-acetylmuramic acid kinase [Candidatus Eisenbacteria bacterium]|nr:anhydro-N-acetylmuramic acid kinase [Candidatus Eisenbacteria bacterium]
MSRSGSLRVIGLLSGTSMDGIDAALLEIRGVGSLLQLQLEAFAVFPFGRADRARLSAIAGRGPRDAEERARLHVRVGELFARAASRLAARHGGIGAVDLIGSHGQTILHAPARRGGATVQIGCGVVIAERTGVPTVHDFRSADIAAGGEGAPLLPIADYLLFRSSRVDRVLLNIGGIANLTVLPAGGAWEETLAYDTGPGNALLDRLAALASGGREDCDRGGRRAARGTVHRGILRALLAHPFLRRRPPRSTGTEVFGDALARDLWDRGRAARIGADDLLATAAAFTAASAAGEIRKRSAPGAEVYLCGGGARNRTLVRRLAEEIAPRNLLPIERLGIPADAREAVGFAVLAAEFARGARYPMKAITGARGAPLLGILAPGPRSFRLRIGRSGPR